MGKFLYKDNLTKEQYSKYKDQSKEKLLNFCKTKITNTMIGALDILEKHLDLNNVEANEWYMAVRKEILDNGNNQIRHLEDELERYDVEWVRYQYDLVFRKDQK